MKRKKAQIKTRIGAKVISCNFAFCFVLFSVISAFLFAWFGVTNASTLYFLPQSQDIYSGDTFIIEVGIDTEKKEINAIEGTILFSKDKLEVTDINKGGSAVSLWVENPVFSNEKGEVGFSGGMPNGFIGKGIVLKITFKAIGEELDENDAKVYFTKSSKILLNDGKGTLDSLDFTEGNYKVIEKPENLPFVVSESNPDQNKWYNSGDLHLHWDLNNQAEYSYILSKDALAEPDEIPDKPEGELVWAGDINYRGLEDGIYYFHLKQKLPGEKWSSKMTFRAMIDNTKPDEFTLQITEIEGKKYLVFSAKDLTSGVEYYQVKEKKEQGIFGKFIKRGEINFEKAASPYLLKDKDLGSVITVAAVDKAGNARMSEIGFSQKSLLRNYALLILPMLILAILIVFWLKREIVKKK